MLILHQDYRFSSLWEVFFVDVIDEGFAVEGLGGSFEVLNHLIVETDAVGQRFIFCYDFTLASDGGMGSMTSQKFVPIENLTSTLSWNETGLTVKLATTKPHHQMLGIAVRGQQPQKQYKPQGK